MNVAVVGGGFLAAAIRDSVREGDPAHTAVILVAPDTTDGTDYDLSEIFQTYGPGLHVIAAPVPVGTHARLRQRFPATRFAIVPENVRRATARDDWRRQPFVFAGVDDALARVQIEQVYGKFTDELLFMSPVSAELTKHAINGFLALSIGYIKRLARVADRLGVDIGDVSRGLKADPRIGHRAYLGPDGEPGDHLLRDVQVLRRVGCS